MLDVYGALDRKDLSRAEAAHSELLHMIEGADVEKILFKKRLKRLRSELSEGQ